LVLIVINGSVTLNTYNAVDLINIFLCTPNWLLLAFSVVLFLAQNLKSLQMRQLAVTGKTIAAVPRPKTTDRTKSKHRPIAEAKMVAAAFLFFIKITNVNERNGKTRSERKSLIKQQILMF